MPQRESLVSRPPFVFLCVSAPPRLCVHLFTKSFCRIISSDNQKKRRGAETQKRRENCKHIFKTDS